MQSEFLFIKMHSSVSRLMMLWRGEGVRYSKTFYGETMQDREKIRFKQVFVIAGTHLLYIKPAMTESYETGKHIVFDRFSL